MPNNYKTFLIMNTKFLLKFLAGLSFIFSFNGTFAQCPNNNTQFGTSNAPNAVGVLTTLSTCLYGGEYRLVNNLVAGSTYSFETCGDTDFDTQLTVYDDVTGAFVEFNDDFCGLQSTVQFVSNGNPVRVLIDKYNCTNQSSCMTLGVTRVTDSAPVADPCNSITNLTCGSVGTFDLSDTGAWNPPGPWGTPGEEQVFSFTPTVSGSHQISVTNQGGYVDLFSKTGSCGSSDWTYIDDVFSTAQNSLNLTAGVTYLFLIDDENTNASSGAIQITCPNIADPCDDIVDIASCGTTVNYTLGTGAGQWNPPGPWGTPGKEAVFSFTPSTSGDYDVSVTNDNFYVDLFVKTGTCDDTGWTYVDDIFTTATNSFTLTAGVTYFFLIDDENTTESSGTFTIDCPCIPPAGGIDGSYTYTSPFTISSTTIDACDDCNLRTSEDRIYEVAISCEGSYKFSTCGNSWDTYLYLRTAPCGGSSIAINDDACGLQSEITAQLQPGTYYIHVEGFSSLSQGAFDLNITGILSTPIIGAVSGTEDVCENDTGVSYSVTGNFDSFNWSVPSGASIVSGNGTAEVLIDFGSASGVVGVVASNSCGSNSSSISVSVNPSPVFNTSSSAVTCPGGNDGIIELSATVGTAPFTYSLNGNSNSSGVFNGLSSGSYNASAIDANGCSSEIISVTVNEPSVISPPTVVCNDVDVEFNGEATIDINGVDLYDDANSFDPCGDVTFSGPALVTVDCDNAGDDITVMVEAINSYGVIGSCMATITIDGLPCDWIDSDGIGCSGDAEYDFTEESFTLNTTDCSAAFPYLADQVSFAYQDICGDATIIAEVTIASDNAFGGIMIREDASPGARKMAIATNTIDRMLREVRVVPNYPAFPVQSLSFDKYWLKIEKSNGFLFKGSVSTDGVNYIPFINQAIQMNSCTQVGLYVYSKDGNPASASFENVSITTALPLEGIPNTIAKSNAHIGNTITLYPNPTNSEVHLNIDSYFGERMDIRIFNANGQLMTQRVLDAVESDIETFDVSQFTPGMYWIRVVVDGKQETIKLIVD